MIKILRTSYAFWTVAVVALAIGCASDSGAKKSDAAQAKGDFKNRQYVANASKVKFGEFKYVELKETELAPEHRINKDNQGSAKKIDAMLLAQLKTIWPDINVVSKDGGFSKPNERTLQISPSITDIHLVSIGARVWIGVMAGGSDIVMHVDYRDSSTGEVIANPDFWKGNNAWSGGRSWGQSDNEIRDAVVGQIIFYTLANK
jgi:hypothetical protein